MKRLALCILAAALLAGCLSNEHAPSEAKATGCAQGTIQDWPGTSQRQVCVHQQYLLNGQWDAIEQDFATLKVNPPAVSSQSEDWVNSWQQASTGAVAAHQSLQTRLTALQMDSLGQPTWPEIELLREEAAGLKQHIDEPYEAQLSSDFGSQARDLRSDRLVAIAQTLPAFLVGAVLACGLAFAVAMRWKKRTEYYRPYASKRVFTAPELVLAVVGFTILVVSLVVASILGLPGILRSLMVIGGV